MMSEGQIEPGAPVRQRACSKCGAMCNVEVCASCASLPSNERCICMTDVGCPVHPGGCTHDNLVRVGNEWQCFRQGCSFRLSGGFKNFHRLLCERFGYAHDEKDWQRDQLSLIEHLAKRRESETNCDATWQPVVGGPVVPCTLPAGHEGKHLAPAPSTDWKHRAEEAERTLAYNMGLANRTTRRAMNERNGIIHELRKRYSTIEIADMAGLTRQRVHQILNEAPVESPEKSESERTALSEGVLDHLAERMQAFGALREKSPKELVELALEHIDLSGTASLLLHELLSRVHPGWEEE